MSNFGTVRKFASKKSLREAVAAEGADKVMVTDTSAFGNRGTIPASELSTADVIVGPDPYTDRRWFANVVNGKVK